MTSSVVASPSTPGHSGMVLFSERAGAQAKQSALLLTVSRLSPLLSAIALAALWWLAAALTDTRHLPPPQAVAERLWAELISGELLPHLGATLWRVAASFAIAMAAGSAIGILLGRNRQLDRFFDSWVVLFLNLPALVVIILCYVWFGLTEAAAITAVAINKIPNVAVTVREGARALSRQLDEMGAIYRFSRRDMLRHVHLPQLAPYFAAAARSGLALVWKIVLVVELLGLSSGVGFQLYTLFQLFDVAGIIAYALAFIAVVLVIEATILTPWQRAANRWRA
jgi:NitT/TauT family transport system permease protein